MVFVRSILKLVLCLTVSPVYGQNPQQDNSGLRIMFYNVENLFHPSNDSLKNDDEFTEEGTRFWTYKRYSDKLSKVGKTIIAVGEWEPPAIVGLCEIENIQCLNDLVYDSPLARYGYKIIHFESGDNRGIDVAMLYRPEWVQPIFQRAIILDFGEDSRPTRDILYTQFLTTTADTLHVYVNHWPSRYGGQLATAPKRDFAATTLRAQYDSLLAINSNASIVAMGDFNDHPDDNSMLNILRAKKDSTSLTPGDLVNLIWQYEFVKGTHKYQHEWGILDQFIVTRAMINGSGKLSTTFNSADIFEADFLLETEKDGVGKLPFRTYVGFTYHGGYSDHLPIYLDLYFSQKK